MRRFAIRSGPQTFVLAPGVYRIGRAPTSDIRLDDASVSRTHATLRVDLERVVLEERGSRNGIRVNGDVRRGAIVLGPGDKILLGTIELLLLEPEPTPDDAEAAATKPLPRLARTSDRPARSVLSTREREVLERIARGVTQREIAETLGVSVKTVETYRARITEKLGITSRAELVEYAIASGVLKTRRPTGRPPPPDGT
jgi:DNA-binding CsgD family transcriptional regulator